METINTHLFSNISNTLNKSHRIEQQQLLYFRLFATIYMTFAMYQVDWANMRFMTHFIYLTLWGAMFTYVYFYLAVIENISYFINGNQYFHENLWKVCHLLFIIAFCLEMPIFLMFWGYIFPNIEIETLNGWILNISIHGISCVLIFIDLLLNDIQFIWKQLPILIGLSFCYLLTNMIYVKTTGIEIYPGISWDNLITFIVSIMTFLIVIGVFTLGKLYYDKVKQPLISKTVLLG